MFPTAILTRILRCRYGKGGHENEIVEVVSAGFARPRDQKADLVETEVANGGAHRDAVDECVPTGGRHLNRKLMPSQSPGDRTVSWCSGVPDIQRQAIVEDA